MISFDQYKLLKRFENNVFSAENDYSESTMNSLCRSKFVVVSKITEYPNYFVPNEFTLTELGKSAIEEYEQFILNNKRSKASNYIAWISLIVSIIAVIVSVFKECFQSF